MKLSLIIPMIEIFQYFMNCRIIRKVIKTFMA